MWISAFAAIKSIKIRPSLQKETMLVSQIKEFDNKEIKIVNAQIIPNNVTKESVTNSTKVTQKISEKYENNSNNIKIMAKDSISVKPYESHHQKSNSDIKITENITKSSFIQPSPKPALSNPISGRLSLVSQQAKITVISSPSQNVEDDIICADYHHRSQKPQIISVPKTSNSSLKKPRRIMVPDSSSPIKITHPIEKSKEQIVEIESKW